MSNTGYFQYNLRTVVHCAAGATLRIPSLFEGLGGKRVLLLSDQGLKQAGLVDHVASVFDNGGCGPQLVGVYTDIAPDAACETLNAALSYAREIAADSLLALGGGSVLDAAKGIKYALYHNLIDVRDAIQAGIKIESWPLAGPMGVPHIAVPTTAGTGAEATPVAVLYNETLGIKGNILAPFIEADVAVLDANHTRGLPPKITAATGMDALTHAIEAITSPNANHFTDAQAFLSARLIVDNLPTAVHAGQEVDARSTMLQASTMACSAFSNALNAAPVHNCAHAFGALYHIPHGDANAALLPIVMEALPEFYVPQAQRLAAALGLDVGGNSGELLLMDVIERIVALQRDIGCASDFAAFDISPEDGDKIAAAIAADPAALFYPIPVEAITSIVARAIGHSHQSRV
jgi:alcohol dehydrogenase class IV